MKRKNQRICCLLLQAALLLVLLCGCSTEPVPPPSFFVSFQLPGQAQIDQAVERGSLPDLSVLSHPGILITGWLDAAGQPADPENTPVEADAVYTAVCLPEFNRHEAYLFPDETGDLRPYEVLTGSELSEALQALAAPEAVTLLPEIPAGALSPDGLRAALLACFPEAQLLAGFIAEDPEADRLTLLRMAYDYCRDSFVYMRKEILEFGLTGWEIPHAKSILTSGYGNCYDYAASFWALSRGLGYEAECLSGYILELWQPHGWVEITIDGQLYAFDPEEESACRVKRLVFTEDMFMMTYDGSEYRQYVCPQEEDLHEST